MQGHVKAHINWEDLRGQGQDGKGKNKVKMFPVAQLLSNLVSGCKSGRHQVRSLTEVSTILLMT